METISATGVALTPVVIWKGKTQQQQWYPKALRPYEGWHFCSTDKGWTDNKIALE